MSKTALPELIENGAFLLAATTTSTASYCLTLDPATTTTGILATGLAVGVLNSAHAIVCSLIGSPGNGSFRGLHQLTYSAIERLMDQVIAEAKADPNSPARKDIRQIKKLRKSFANEWQVLRETPGFEQKIHALSEEDLTPWITAAATGELDSDGEPASRALTTQLWRTILTAVAKKHECEPSTESLSLLADKLHKGLPLAVRELLVEDAASKKSGEGHAYAEFQIRIFGAILDAIGKIAEDTSTLPEGQETIRHEVIALGDAVQNEAETLRASIADQNSAAVAFYEEQVEQWNRLRGWLESFKAEILQEIANSRQETSKVAPAPSQPNNLPHRSLGSLFKGRTDFLQEMESLLNPSHVENPADNLPQIRQTKPLVLSAGGGIGKTRAAIEYAWQHQQQYTALLFVQLFGSDNSPQTLDSQLAKLTSILDITGMEGQTDEVRLRAVLDWLERRPGWLLILDNVDTSETAATVRDCLAQLTAGHVVITSRLNDWPASVEKLKLDVLDLKSATDYLVEAASERAPAEDDREQAEQTAEKVGRLALGLEHAAAYVNSLGASFADYVEAWRENESAILEEFDLDQIEYPRELLVTWKLSADRLTEPAQRLLETLSWFAPDPIPTSILSNLPDNYLDTEPTKAVAELAKFSLVTRQPESRSFLLHGLVQATTRHHLRYGSEEQGGKEQQEHSLPSLEGALAWVDASFGDPQDVRDWPVLEPLLPHAIAVCDSAEVEGKTTTQHATSRLLNNAGMLLDGKANYLEAEPLYRRALAIDEAIHGGDHPNIAIRLNNLAQLLQATNRLKEAEPLMRRVVAIFEKSYGKDHPRVATALSNLAQLLKDTNCLEEAERLMRRALAIDEASYGADHPDVAIALNNLATLLQATNRLKEAEPLMERVVGIFEKSYGEDHPNVAIALNNLAQLLQATNRLKEAEPLMRRALAIDEASFGTDHPKVAIRLNNLAQLLKMTNRLEEAEPLFRHALAIHEASYGADHPNVATALNNLAQLLKDTNCLKEAEPLMERVVGIFEKSYGEDHPNVAIALNNLAQLLQATNRLKEADPLMRHHAEIFLKFTLATGHEHPHLQIGLNNYGALLLEMGNSEAEVRQKLNDLLAKYGMSLG